MTLNRQRAEIHSDRLWSLMGFGAGPLLLFYRAGVQTFPASICALSSSRTGRTASPLTRIRWSAWDIAAVTSRHIWQLGRYHPCWSALRAAWSVSAFALWRAVTQGGQRAPPQPPHQIPA